MKAVRSGQVVFLHYIYILQVRFVGVHAFVDAHFHFVWATEFRPDEGRLVHDRVGVGVVRKVVRVHRQLLLRAGLILQLVEEQELLLMLGA